MKHRLQEQAYLLTEDQGRSQDFVKGGECVEVIIRSKIYNLGKNDR